jgi:N-glycosylase/DNA lyase
MISHEPIALSRAVAAICPDIKSQIESNIEPNERDLWWELSTCVLSSQVPFSLAVSAANEIDKKGLLLTENDDIEVLAHKLFEVLSSPLNVEGGTRKYRFPELRSRHLAATHTIVTKEYGSLVKLLASFDNASEARSWLIKHVPGLGPKQSSMFLRNIGASYELAILDRHVLNYMSALGIYSGDKPYISSINTYRQCEVLLRGHADDLECSVGLLDWAIWIVMRVANSETRAEAA